MNHNLYSIDLIKNIINNEIEKALDYLPKNMYAKVVSRDGETVDVCMLTSDIDSAMPKIFHVPIARTIYNHFPVKENDVGILVGISKEFYHKFDNNDTSTTLENEAVEGVAYIFIPLAPPKTDLNDDVKTMSLFSQNGKRSVKITDDDITLKDEDGNAVTLDKDGLKLEDKNGNKIVLNSEGVTINDNFKVMK